jgi:4-coumarate--CoA ligase
MNNYDKLELKHTRSIKYVMSGAAPIGAHDAERFQQRAPNAKFFQGYGLTEASPVVLMSVLGSQNHASVGFPTPDTEAKVVGVNDPEFRGLGPNESGEIWIRGPQIMAGYHNNEKATNETITSDGWLRTGDIGHYDENFEFYITDRLKELIKVKGFQVPPAELEELLRDHPAVADAAVIGVPHPKAGEVPRAYIVKKKGVEVNENDIKEFIKSKVAKYKRLEGGVEFIQAIPKNATGKILRRELKVLFHEKSKSS